MKRLWTLSLLLAAGWLHGTALALIPADFTELEQQLAALKTSTGLQSGTAIAVVKDGKLLYQHYAGYADIAAQQAVSADTAFYIASATKPMTALSLLLLAQQGKLSTETKLQAMFPQQRFSGVDAGKVSLAQLLSHQSGIQNPALVWATAYSGVHTPESLLQLVAQTKPDPESQHGQFNYSNLGYNLASLWQDKITGQSWQQSLQQQLFTPLQMQHSTAYVSEAKRQQWPLAKPYSLFSPEPTQPLYLTKTDQTMHAAGGVLSSAADLARFLVAQLQPSKAINWQVVQQSQQQQASADTSYGDFARTGYAWGWYLGPYKTHNMLHHFGGFAGFSSHLSFMPEQGLGLVILHNEDVLAKDLNNLIADYCYGLLLGDHQTKARVKQGFANLSAKAAALPAMRAAQQKKISSRAVLLSLPPSAYVGVYRHPQLGDLQLSLNANKAFELRWGQLHAIATGYEQQDSLRVELVPNSGEVLQFRLSGNQVQQLQLDAMVFQKQP